MMQMSPMSARRPVRRLLSSLLVVAAAWLYVFPYSRALNSANERPRVLQARAIVEHGQLHIGTAFRDDRGRVRYRDLYGTVHGGLFVNDMALVCTDENLEPPRCTGRLYPAKAPGTALLGVVPLAVARAMALVPEGAQGEVVATWVARTFGVMPLALMALGVVGWLLLRSGVSGRQAAASVLATGLGTSYFSYGVNFVGSALAGSVLVIGAALLVVAQTRPRGQIWAACGGFVAAWAVLFEYHAAIAVAWMALWVLLKASRRRLVWGFAAGAGVVAGIHAVLHIAMFGSPLGTGHFFLASAHNRTSQSAGFLGLDGFHLESLAAHLFDPYMGLVPLMPWLVVAAAGLLARRSARTQRPSTAAPGGWVGLFFGMVLAYLLFVSCLDRYRMMNGWSIGPRYLVPAVLPLAALAGLGWARLAAVRPLLGALVSGLAMASMVMVSAVTVAFAHPPSKLNNAFGDFAVPLLMEGHGVRNFGLELGWGSWSLLPFGLLLGGCALYLVWLLLMDHRWRMRVAVALLAATAWVLFMGVLFHPTPPQRRARMVEFARTHGEGASPTGKRRIWDPG